MRKPALQVFVRGFERITEDGRCLVCILPRGQLAKQPDICTGHQAFHELCLEIVNDGCELPMEFPFSVCEYKFNPFAPLLEAEITSKGTLRKLGAAKPKQAPRGNLPFGVKRKKRKRAPNKKRQRVAAAPASAGATDWDAQEIQSRLGGAVAQDAADTAERSATESEHASHNDGDHMESGPSEDEGPSLRAEPGASATSASASACGLMKEDLAEETFQTPEAAKEEQKVSQLEADREKRLAAKHASAATAAPKTRCNANLGLVDAGIQESGRLAGCRHCLQKIQKGSARFQFAWSLTKFASWLHEGCVVPHLLQENADLEHAKDFLATVLCKDQKDQVRAATLSVQRLLANHMNAGASSSTGGASASH